jgi:hypothetical protein
MYKVLATLLAAAALHVRSITQHLIQTTCKAPHAAAQQAFSLPVNALLIHLCNVLCAGMQAAQAYAPDIQNSIRLPAAHTTEMRPTRCVPTLATNSQPIQQVLTDSNRPCQ